MTLAAFAKFPRLRGIWLIARGNKAFCLMLLNNDLLYIIGEIFDKYFLERAVTLEERYKQMFTSGGFFNIFKFWLMGGCRESPGELADMFLHFL